MGKVYETIGEELREFLLKQPIFFVATAPLAETGLVNLSPKGLDSLRILDDQTVAYADLVGSGIETVAHIKENGRMVIMFCAFEGAPKIVRLHGVATVVERRQDAFKKLMTAFPDFAAIRSIITLRCSRISESCGFGVPLFEFKGQRSVLTDWGKQKSESQIEDYINQKNLKSLDGLDGMDRIDHNRA